MKRIGESRQYHTIKTATYPAYVAERERSKGMALLDFFYPKCVGCGLEKANIYIIISYNIHNIYKIIIFSRTDILENIYIN